MIKADKNQAVQREHCNSRFIMHDIKFETIEKNFIKASAKISSNTSDIIRIDKEVEKINLLEKYRANHEKKNSA